MIKKWTYIKHNKHAEICVVLYIRSHFTVISSRDQTTHTLNGKKSKVKLRLEPKQEYGDKNLDDTS